MFTLSAAWFVHIAVLCRPHILICLNLFLICLEKVLLCKQKKMFVVFLAQVYKGLYLNYVTQLGEGGGKYFCYNLILIVSQMVTLV